jgi:outer membrane protein TolC
VQARAGRSSDLVAVYQALGGGWGPGTPGPLAQTGPATAR